MTNGTERPGMPLASKITLAGIAFCAAASFLIALLIAMGA
jgi:hypothetical protein